MNERGVREVHRSIPVSFHQTRKSGQVPIIDRPYGDGARVQKRPGRIGVRSAVPKQMKQLGQAPSGLRRGRRGDERQQKLGERFDTGSVPVVVTIEQRDYF